MKESGSRCLRHPIAVCGFEHGVRQLGALGLTGLPNPSIST